MSCLLLHNPNLWPESQSSVVQRGNRTKDRLMGQDSGWSGRVRNINTRERMPICFEDNLIFTPLATVDRSLEAGEWWLLLLVPLVVGSGRMI